MLALSVVVLAGCGSVPRPFKPDAKQDAINPLHEIQDSLAVVVAPLENDVSEPPNTVADYVVRELRRANIPATTNDSLSLAYFLQGKIKGNATPKEVAIDWVLTDFQGNAVMQESTKTVNDAQKIAAASARLVAGVLQSKNAGREGKTKPLSLGVVEVTGAPGDGNKSLRLAFETVLRRAGLPIAIPAAKADVQIFGDVKIKDAEADTQSLAITWRLKAKDGQDLGEMTQRNTIQAGQTSAEWGPLAYDITFAMVDTIANIFVDIERFDIIRRQATQ